LAVTVPELVIAGLGEEAVAVSAEGGPDPEQVVAETWRELSEHYQEDPAGEAETRQVVAAEEEQIHVQEQEGACYDQSRRGMVS
jgi:hypothetical protein